MTPSTKLPNQPSKTNSLAIARLSFPVFVYLALSARGDEAVAFNPTLECLAVDIDPVGNLDDGRCKPVRVCMKYVPAKHLFGQKWCFGYKLLYGAQVLVIGQVFYPSIRCCMSMVDKSLPKYDCFCQIQELFYMPIIH
ncbi:hypothetical protein FHS76_003990 [Ochrobactrum daejeonense]|uniref:Uncharacterized protein n=1 Tax=Brucella daejeonensis TaxID=659015 RepID=A0A7W9B0M4_9HYPH|nr:hypothetical protein [Brucella daejeonensis]MBB5704075.1 hypothetical protein [Brucella daejeonensis]